MLNQSTENCLVPKTKNLFIYLKLLLCKLSRERLIGDRCNVNILKQIYLMKISWYLKCYIA